MTVAELVEALRDCPGGHQVVVSVDREPPVTGLLRVVEVDEHVGEDRVELVFDT